MIAVLDPEEVSDSENVQVPGTMVDGLVSYWPQEIGLPLTYQLLKSKRMTFWRAVHRQALTMNATSHEETYNSQSKLRPLTRLSKRNSLSAEENRGVLEYCIFLFRRTKVPCDDTKFV